MKNSKPQVVDQHKSFLEAARELGCDDDKDRFEAKLGKLAKAAPRPAKAAPKAKTTARPK